MRRRYKKKGLIEKLLDGVGKLLFSVVFCICIFYTLIRGGVEVKMEFTKDSEKVFSVIETIGTGVKITKKIIKTARGI